MPPPSPLSPPPSPPTSQLPSPPASAPASAPTPELSSQLAPLPQPPANSAHADPPVPPHAVPYQAVNHYENFPVASWLCPARLRAPIAAIYHFARTADDIADEGSAPAAQRLAELHALRQALHSISPDTDSTNAPPPDIAPTLRTQPQWAWMLAPLHAALCQHRLPTALLHDLLDAFVQDVEKTRDAQDYASEAELRDYCRRSANPIGRLLLHLYGIHNAQALAQSDAICTALQLINFWQDPSVDLPRGRVYFSTELQTRFGVQRADLLACRQTPAITQMLQACAQTARHTLLQGSPLVHQLPGRMGWELRLVVQGGLRILEKVSALHYATLHQRPTLRAADSPLLLWRALRMSARTAH